MKKETSIFALGQKAFTLVEIMIVVVIIGSLMAILGKNVMDRFQKARQNQAFIQIKEVSKSFEQYNIDCGSYPSTEQGFQALMQNPGGDACPNWGPNPYIKAIPKDPWGAPLMYESDGGKFVIRSYGRDKKPGGSGLDKDISSDDEGVGGGSN